MSGRHVGTFVRLRPGLSRWHDTPIFRAGIAARFIGWLAIGWPITTTALLAVATVIAATAPLVVAFGAVVLVWSMITRTSPAQKLVGPIILVAAGVMTWTQLGAAGHTATLLLVLMWPLDAVVDQYWTRYRTWRLWCEFRRGLPSRFAIMAAKSTRIQGVIDGEVQLTGQDRPALDHPALDLRATITANTITCRCSVSPGRNHHALREVLDELAASFPHIHHLDLVFTDEYQTFGHLITTIGPPTTQDQTVKGDRAFSALYRAIPHVALVVGLVLVVRTAIS